MIQILTGINNTSAALDCERTRLDVIGQNLANAQTTRDVDGKPYQRRVVIFQNVLNNAMNPTGNPDLPAMQIARVEKDQRPGVPIHQPGNPDADEHGMVFLPNVNVHEEMADYISAQRAFEANLAVVKNARSMAMQTLAIGKH
jgi:flagellar basal-body rod protein FlgC